MVLSILTTPFIIWVSSLPSHALLQPFETISRLQNTSLLFFAFDSLHAFLPQTGTFSSFRLTSYLLIPICTLALGLVVTFYGISSLTLQNEVDTFPRGHNSFVLIQNIALYYNFPFISGSSPFRHE